MRQIQQLTEHVFIFPFSKKSFIFLIRLPPTQSTYAQSNLKKVKTNVGSDFFLCYPMIFPYKSMQICVGEEVVCRFPSARWLYKLLDDMLLFPLGPSLIYWILKVFLRGGTASVKKTTDALCPLTPHSSACTSIVVVGPLIWGRGERFGFEPSPAGQEAETESLRLFTNDPAFTVK